MEKGNEIKTVVPALRFPEFRWMNEWEENKLNSLCYIINGKCNAQDHVEGGKYPLFDRSAIVKYSNDYLYDCEAIIIPGEGAKFAPKYYIGKFNLHQRAYALKDFSCNGRFLFYCMEYYSGLLAIKAVKSTVLSLRLPILQNFLLYIPNTNAEQQKIADCLSSLDDLIEATAQKVDALKEHKKGLIQRLFPAEGKNVPDLRFPEFQASEKWERKIIQDICNITTGNKNTQDKKENGIYPFFVRSPKVERIDSWSFDGEAILTAGDGVGVGKIFHYYVGKMGVHQRVYLLYDIQCNSKYLYYFFSEFFYERVKKMSAKNSVDSVRKDMISDMPLLLPSSQEQQKIADCLSSLDELIEATSQKVEILKEHKKGLMQQLFPKI